MNFADYLSEQPETARNYKGEQEKIKWPKGKAIARCGNVWLIKTGRFFAVVYGLQILHSMDRTEASREFSGCCFHQAQCEGLLD